MTKAQTIAYWVTTGILVFCMTGGIFELLSVRMTIENMMKLGYPAYIIPLLGLGKVLAVAAILWPGFPRLKEWAYAGIFFNMTGATVSHIANRDGSSIVVVTATIAAFTLASWALRPQSRRLGTILGPTERTAKTGHSAHLNTPFGGAAQLGDPEMKTSHP
jgi:DoxX-like family